MKQGSSCFYRPKKEGRNKGNREILHVRSQLWSQHWNQHGLRGRRRSIQHVPQPSGGRREVGGVKTAVERGSEEKLAKSEEVLAGSPETEGAALPQQLRLLSSLDSRGW